MELLKYASRLETSFEISDLDNILNLAVIATRKAEGRRRGDVP